MIWVAMVHVAGNLALIAIPILGGYLAGRHHHRILLEQVERDAWEDGFTLGVHIMTPCSDDLDDDIGDLDAAVRQQADPPADPIWN